jgi:hypothetical protein
MTAFVVMIGGTERLQLPALDLGDVVFTPQFRTENQQPDGIRTGHVMETLKNPDSRRSPTWGARDDPGHASGVASKCRPRASPERASRRRVRYAFTKSSRSGLRTSAWVVSMPCG